MFKFVIFLALVVVAPIQAAEVTVTNLDGTSMVGELRSWSDGQIVIDHVDGEQRLSSDELLSLEWPPTPSRQKGSAESTAIQLELSDGSLIPIDEFTSSAAAATVTPALSLPSQEESLTFSRKQLAAVRLQPLTASAVKQWQEIRQTNFPSDVLVLLKRGGKSLDYIEGIVGDVSANTIEFKLDGEVLRIDRNKVAGIVYYRARSGRDAEPRCRVKGRSGLVANVSRASLADGMLQMQTIVGAEFSWPMSDIHLSDFSAGKLKYLSDMQPASERWTPLVALPAGATFAAEYGRPRYNHSAYGGPLKVRRDEASYASRVRETRSFNKGLSLRSRTELVYRVPDGFRRFTTFAGIDPSASASANVRLEIHGDDRLLFEEDVTGHDPPHSIQLDIAGVKRLKILVDYGRNLDTGDWLNLCDARIVK